MDCLSDNDVFAFVERRLVPGKARAVEEHIGVCANCRTLVAEATKFCLGRRDESDAQSEADGAADRLPSGAKVSRYVVDHPLGAGGGGVVYQAYDPQLQRHVAIKLLRPARAGESASSQARLLREAQSMARLSHPNVVSVFDAGTYQEAVFVVMELVEGETLAAWLRRAKRSWREVIAVFADAARGLAAAHVAGLVHRDFKPENVLVGTDGRVRVTDFGLARPLALARVGGGDHEGAAAALAAGASVTTLAGTPAYMAPEQFLTGSADARTDQFNFCVALHLALFGKHPFAEGLAEGGLLNLVGHLVQVDFPPAVDAEQVPGWLRELLRRGLASRPEDRYPSLDPVIAALAGHGAKWSSGRRIAVAVAAAVTVGLGATVAGLGGRSVAAAVCGNGRVERGEECDDGNGSASDGCVSCKWARCGDGVIRKGVEECDDGNLRDGDGCSASCLACPGGRNALVWPENGHCYTRHDEPLPWLPARQACGLAGGDLVTYTGFQEARALRDTLLVGGPGDTWIGFSADARGQYTWLGDEAASPLWAEKGQLEPALGRCVYQERLMKFYGPGTVDPGIARRSAACERPLPFVCEQAPWTLRPSDNHAYHLDFHEVTWQQADAGCRRVGAHLVSIHDGEEQAFVAALAAGEVWIGATDVRQEGHFEWVSGEPFGFRKFAPGEPDDGFNTDDCVVLGAEELWHDRKCGHLHAFVCEID